MSEAGTQGGGAARLTDILGQDRAIATLNSAVASGRVHHAWIFSGPKGVGKFTAATAFAAALLDPDTRIEDGRVVEALPGDRGSEARSLLDRGAHPDLHIIRKELARFSDDSSVRSRVLSTIPKPVVDRFLLQPIARAPVRRDGGLISKAFIIDEAELLDRSTRHAPNQASLLKTLEEPPAGSVIILVTSNEGRLIPTVRSRCQRVAFGLLSDEDMRGWMERMGVRSRIASLVGDELRNGVAAIRSEMDSAYAEDARERAKGGKGTLSAPKRKYYEALTDVLERSKGADFVAFLDELPEAALKALEKSDAALLERARGGPSSGELDWLTHFSAGSPGRLLDAAITRLYDWHLALDPLFRGQAGGYEIGMTMKVLVDEWAKAHVKRGRGENRSKEAANLEAIRHLIVLLGERADDGVRRVIDRAGPGESLRRSAALHRMLGVVDSIQTGERRLSANVNLEQGLVALGAALRA
ncbi:MAG: hypothetical protein ACTS3F_05080 [Phycisphaerales bacterium]